MIDPFGRKITHLRISVTQKCNLKCFYCHHEGETKASREMSLDKIITIVKSFAHFGVKYVKITGGEPLCRPDILEIIKEIAQIKNIEDVSMTTNGFNLTKLADPLKKAGLDRINIGCDSVNLDITSKRLINVKEALKAAKLADLSPIKLNMVVLKNININDVEPLINYAREENLILQLIELIPAIESNRTADTDEYFKKYYYPLTKLETKLLELSSEVHIRQLQGRKQYTINGAIVEVVNPSHEEFCQKCSKMRVTSDGWIKPCLMRNDNAVKFVDCTSILEAVQLRKLYVK